MLRKILPLLCLNAIFAVIALPASAQIYKELISFNGNTAAGPEAQLAQGIDGSVYGTTTFGGTGDCNGTGGIGCGTVFAITHNGEFQILYNFQTSGLVRPYLGLVLARSGDFYGMANLGGYASIFKLTPQGDVSLLYQFAGGNHAGYDPSALPTLGTDGNFYGTTESGGTPSNSCPSGCGTVYKMTPAGVVTTIYSFCPQNYCPDGEGPAGALAQGLDGNFYGTATGGGLYKAGTIFKITPNGKFTLLYTFDNLSPGGAGLLLGNDGNFYGTTGNNLYQVTPQGTVTELPNFQGSGGLLPIVGSDGNFYWPSPYGALHNFGGIFEMSPTGSPSTLYNFAGYPNDGSEPVARLVQATSGTFYGTTYTGGSSPCNYGEYPGCGTVYSLDMGLGPFVAFVNRAGRVGEKIGILGEGFKGTTAVEFNGTPATFTVRSQTLLIATVPAGASSGYVKVTTPTRTLTSNVPFYVIP